MIDFKTPESGLGDWMSIHIECLVRPLMNRRCISSDWHLLSVTITVL